MNGNPTGDVCLWVVLLEALTWSAPLEAMKRVLNRLGGHHPAALFSPGRCAVQVHLAADTADHALAVAVATWREAVRAEGLEDWNLVRIEVKTSEELAAELRIHQEATERITSQGALHAAYVATRRLLRVHDASGAAAVLTGLAHHLGGHVVPAGSAGRNAVPLDLSFGTMEPVHATAEPLSVSRLHLEETLPLVFHDAWLLLERSQQCRAESREASEVGDALAVSERTSLTAPVAPSPGRCSAEVPQGDRLVSQPGMTSKRPEGGS